MVKRGKSYNTPRSIDIDLDRVRIGGNYAAMLRAQGNSGVTSAKINPELEPAHIASEREEYIEKIKNWMREPNWCAGYSWLMLREHYDAYGLTPDEYYEVAKVAINTDPHQMNRLRKDKVSDVRYFELCKIMASQCAFSDVDCEKLNKGTQNGTYKIANLVLDSLCKETADWYVCDAARGIRNMAKEQKYISEMDAAQLLFYMWLLVHNGLVTGVSDKDITEFVDKGLVIPMDADKYIVKLTQNAQKYPCTGLMKSVRLGEGVHVPEFCRKAQGKVLDIYDEVIKREKAAGK